MNRSEVFLVANASPPGAAAVWGVAGIVTGRSAVVALAGL